MKGIHTNRLKGHPTPSFAGSSGFSYLVGAGIRTQANEFEEVGLFGFNVRENTLNDAAADFDLIVFAPWI